MNVSERKDFWQDAFARVRTNLFSFVGLVVLVIVASCFAIAWWQAKQNPEIGYPWLYFGVSINFMTTLVAYLCARRLQATKDASRQAELQAMITEPIVMAFGEHVKGIHQFRSIPWNTLFNGCSEIDFLVQGWDGWLYEPEVRPQMETFLQRKGRINLFLHHPGEKYIHLQAAMKERITRNDFNPQSEITQTSDRLRQLIKKALPSATIEEQAERLSVRYVKQLNWYCAIRFGEARLLLSLYSHDHHRRFEEPFFLVRTDVFPEIGRWFQNEIEHLAENSEISPPPATTQHA